MSEFSILLMELVFLKYIANKQLVEEEIWNKKGNFFMHFNYTQKKRVVNMI